MPHLVVKFSEDLRPKLYNTQFMEELHELALQTGHFKSDTIKILLEPFGFYLCGGSKKPFIHIDLFLIAGRTTQEKQQIAAIIFKGLNKYLNLTNEISIDLRDRDKDVYLKP